MKRLILGGGLAIWMAIVFAFSHQPGSGSNWEPPLWYVAERKTAHLFEYAVLMIWASGFFRTLYRRDAWLPILTLAFVFSVSYGFLDEVHQFFIFGRGAKVTDVFIDGLGAAAAGALLWWWRGHWLRVK